ncbi:MAG: hypothetical protein ACFE8A_00795 [Candidatus Hodarchaeota archaeon]
MAEQELFEKFVDNLQFDVSEYLDTELTEFQNDLIEQATLILKDNIIGEVKKLGGNLKKNKEKFEGFLEGAEKKLEDEEYKENYKDLKQMFTDYSKKLRELIEKICVAIIPVKEMPWMEILFRNIPRIVIDKKKINFFDKAIAYYGEINCVISRTTIYGKMKQAEPLFAPFMGELDLGGYKLDESQKGSKSQIYSYVSAVIKALDTRTISSQLAKYHEGYQRHGEPICDFLMNKKDLLATMEKVRSGIESKRVESNISVCSIAIPLINDRTSLVLVVDEGKDSDRYTRCFEAIIKFSAACCEAPSSKKADAIQPSQPTGAIRTLGNQELKSWTAEELAEESQKRGGVPPGMETWTEEDLKKMAEERGDGIPEGMEMWTEEELQELARKRQGGGLDIPEWEPDQDLLECSKCSYSLRKGWSECPICGTPVGAKVPTTPSPPPEDKPEEERDKPEEERDKPEKEKDKSEEDKDTPNLL